MGRSQKGLKRSVIQWKITKAKMKTLWFFVILAAVNGEVTQCNDVKRWGEAGGDFPECSKPCGKCSNDEGCDKKTGHCISNKCAQGWQGDKCTTPMCREDQCGWYGQCVAPFQCRCPRKYTRVIKLDDDGEVDEVSCTNQSIDGFVNGFIPTIAVLIFLIIAFNALTGVPKMCVEKEDYNTNQ